MAKTPKDEETKARDDVLRKMLAMKPDPKKPSTKKKAQAKPR